MNADYEKILSVMVPHKKVMTSKIAELTGIKKGRVSMLMSYMNEEGIVKREPRTNPGMSECRWMYYIDAMPHRPELWRTSGISEIMSMWDNMIRQHHLPT
jgi:transcription initiation factor IIE alpha subunit